MIAGREGAIEVIIEAMNKYINDAGICECGCGALWGIIENNGKKQIKQTIILNKCFYRRKHNDGIGKWRH